MLSYRTLTLDMIYFCCPIGHSFYYRTLTLGAAPCDEAHGSLEGGERLLNVSLLSLTLCLHQVVDRIVLNLRGGREGGGRGERGGRGEEGGGRGGGEEGGRKGERDIMNTGIHRTSLSPLQAPPPRIATPTSMKMLHSILLP